MNVLDLEIPAVEEDDHTGTCESKMTEKKCIDNSGPLATGTNKISNPEERRYTSQRFNHRTRAIWIIYTGA